jgi:uncharacterized protein
MQARISAADCVQQYGLERCLTSLDGSANPKWPVCFPTPLLPFASALAWAMPEAFEQQIDAILRRDAVRWRLLEVVSNLELPDCWIAAGFIRNAVWDALHGRTPQAPNGDVDVIWFNPDRCHERLDRDIEEELRAVVPSIDWSVKNQARMHSRNDDKPYQSSTDAMRHWPETATAVAARRSGRDELEIASPLGLDDLFNLLLRPTQRFANEKLPIYEERVRSKAWIEFWPLLKRAEPDGS